MASWREPTSRIPLRWGTWAGRSWAGLWLILGGGVAIAGSSAANPPFTVLLAAAGVTAHIVGWCIMPAKGWRRVVVLLPSTAAMVALLSGPGYLTGVTVSLLCWFLVRQRPLRVWPMAAFAVATGIVLARIYPEYDGMLMASAVALFVAVGAAWAARAVHAATARPGRTYRRARSISP
ncbi:MAG TPA: hypothetical protein VGO65_11270 [Pseudolysinimonas sp.]|jgi:hypothetical protein|nr:hypothetical protein [Pseudolysinimonas sp.]